MAGDVGAVVKLFRWARTFFTLPDHLGIFSEVKCHASIEGVERTFPESTISTFLPVANDASLDLIHLLETAILHHGREHFATDPASTVSDDWFLF